jgi:formylglycine-generating enzyme required for sulfatase activity
MLRFLAVSLLLAAGAALAQQPEFVLVPPGSFGQSRFERGFHIGKYEVTYEQFAAFAKATGHITAAERAKAEQTWRSPGFKLNPKQPVVLVTIADASAYCTWVGARLPADDEWEYAARAGATTEQSWGAGVDPRYLWYRGNSKGLPHPVGRKLPNAFGLYDVQGNVWEWTLDQGKAYGKRRGQSWADCEFIDGGPARAASRLIALTTAFSVEPPNFEVLRHDNVGFRCARPE